MRVHFQSPLVLVVTLLSGQELEAQPRDSVRICFAPTTVEASNNAAAAAEAVRAAFTSFLTGPSVSSQPLQARLASQVKEEAKQARCPFLLETTVKLVAKRKGGSVLGQVMAGAAWQGATEAGIANGSPTGRIVGSAAATGFQQATYNYAVTIRTRDELTLGWRLEWADGTVLVENKDKRNAKSDGEDLLTPMVQAAAEKIVEAAKRRAP